MLGSSKKFLVKMFKEWKPADTAVYRDCDTRAVGLNICIEHEKMLYL
jgi:hypothetical protein